MARSERFCTVAVKPQPLSGFAQAVGRVLARGRLAFAAGLEPGLRERLLTWMIDARPAAALLACAAPVSHRLPSAVSPSPSSNLVKLSTR
jgi:hypothetical protein